MKNLIKISSVLAALSVLVVPVIGLAVTAPAVTVLENTFLTGCTLKNDWVDVNAGCTKGAVLSSTATNLGSDIAVCCTMDKIWTVTNWVFLIFISIAFIMLIWGAIGFLTSGGDPAKVTEARNRFLWGIVGVAVAMIAFSIPKIIPIFLK